MDRSPLFLAALASAALPGLDPASVEALPSEPGQLFDVAFIQDTQHRRWVIRAPRTQAAGAQMDVTVALLGLLSRRLPFAVPTPKGFVSLKEGGRAAVYPYLPGQNVDFAKIPAGRGLAAELGRTIAALHNADHQLFEEAGLPAYDPDTYRTRRLSELDRAAATGHVPTGLLSRWERTLEDVSIWRFAPTPTHGDLTGDQVLAVFEDEADASTGRIAALTGWEDAKVADPADDFFALVSQASPAAFETLMEAYAHARVERPDKNLEKRARLASEMRVLSELMGAVASGDRVSVERHAASLRRLDDRVHAEDAAADDYRPSPTRPAGNVTPMVPPPSQLEDDEDEDDVEVMFGKTAEPERDQDASEPAPKAAEDDRPEAETHSTGAADEHAAEADSTGAADEHAAEAGSTSDANGPAAGADNTGDANGPAAGADNTGDADSGAGSASEEPTLIDGPEPGPEFEPGFDRRA